MSSQSAGSHPLPSGSAIGRLLGRLTLEPGPGPDGFSRVLHAEHEEIRKRRRRAGYIESARGEPVRDLTGIALSGGGIRSATFCLGFLQALRQKDALRCFDYLSTVSGGGFIGGWWSAWLTRSIRDGSCFPPQERIELRREAEYLTGIHPDMRTTVAMGDSQGMDAPSLDPVHRLRLFSNYLTPRKGLLSADTWRAVTVVARNLVLTWLALLPVLLAVALAAQLFFVAHPDSAYGFVCIAPRRSTAVAAASLPAICAEVRASQPAGSTVPGEPYEEVLRRRLAIAMEPVSILGVWLLAAVVAWLLVGARGFLQMIGMMAGLLLAATTLYSLARQFGLVGKAQDLSLQISLGTAVMAGGMLVILFLWWLVPAYRDRELLAHRGSQDSREERSNGATRLIAVLLVATAAVAAILLLGGFGHDLFRYLFTFETGHPVYDFVRRAGGWLAAVLALAGMATTAMVTAPSGGGDVGSKTVGRHPALVLSVTPLLSLMVLAVAASSLAHWLLIQAAPTRASESGLVVRATQIVIAVAMALAVIREIHRGRARYSLVARLATVGVLGAGALVVPAAVATSYRLVSPLEGGLILSVLVCVVFTVFEYLTDERQNGTMPPTVVLVLAGVGAVGGTFLLLRLGLLADLQRFSGGGWTGPSLPDRTPAAILVGSAAGLIIGRACVAWVRLGAGGWVLATRPWLARGRQVVPAWLILLAASAIGAGLGWGLSELSIPSDALPIMGVRHTIGNPILAQLCILGLLFASSFVSLDLTLSREENDRVLWLQVAILGLTGPLLMQQYLNPMGASVVFANATLALIGITVALVAGLGWLIDPNDISLHSFYRARLVRAYLGASNRQRGAQGIGVTESVAGDDLPLHTLKNTRACGPYHLINTTLNLVGGRDLATAQRSAASFLLSQRYCGSLRTGFRPTHKYMNGELTLGTALAISGAAASPNMGSKTPSAALGMLLALLNIRLGFWAPTPNQPRWRSAATGLWPFYLLSESLSQTHDLSAYCYLTDGGHFDNTGLYALVERGCRYIVMLDSGADPKPCFADLGEAVRRCRIDFGCEISLGVQNFLPLADSRGLVPWHFVTGSIIYSRQHAAVLGWGSAATRSERTGIVVWVKPSLTDRDPADVRQYALENGNFPQQTTADQWFGEAQFESYRRLGTACGDDLLKEWPGQQMDPPGAVTALFGELQRQMRDRERLPGGVR